MEDESRRLEAEEKYIAGNMTLRALADEMGIRRNTLGEWSKKGNWVEKRRKAMAKAQKKAVNQAVKKKTRELQKLLEASGEAEKALLYAMRQMRKAMEKDRYGIVVGDRYRAGNLAQIIGALGRQAETRMLLSGIMTAADREKIELMRRKQDLDERREMETGSADVSIEMGDAEDYAG